MENPSDFNVDIDIKMLRESLCLAQSAINQIYPKQGRFASETMEKLIAECDRHRPLGVDGKHGRRHTLTCGCEDKGPVEEWEGFAAPSEGYIHAFNFYNARPFCWYQGAVMENPVRNTADYRQITCPECKSIIDENT